MKTLILIVTLLAFTVSLNAQDYAVVDNTRTENKVTNYSQLTQFTSEVILIENFKYRDFLKESKNSNTKFHLDGTILTKVELAKVLRKNAIISENYADFEKIIKNDYPQLMSVLSEKEAQLLYKKFRKGTFNTYVQNLAENW